MRIPPQDAQVCPGSVSDTSVCLRLDSGHCGQAVMSVPHSILPGLLPVLAVSLPVTLSLSVSLPLAATLRPQQTVFFDLLFGQYVPHTHMGFDVDVAESGSHHTDLRERGLDGFGLSVVRGEHFIETTLRFDDLRSGSYCRGAHLGKGKLSLLDLFFGEFEFGRKFEHVQRTWIPVELGNTARTHTPSTSELPKITFG